MENKNNKLNILRKSVYSLTALIAVSNIILWIYFLWADSEFLSSDIYTKILITSISFIILMLIIAGCASVMCGKNKDENK